MSIGGSSNLGPTMVSTLAFYAVSIVVVVAAWRVVVTQDVARAALALVVVLAGLAPLFVMLAAEFVAVVQLLVYVGAVVVLLLFAIMLTRRGTKSTEQALSGRNKVIGAIVAGGLFVGLCASFAGSEMGNDEVAPTTVGRTADVGVSLLRDYVVAFELVSVLLLVTLIGAIVVARKD